MEKDKKPDWSHIHPCGPDPVFDLQPRAVFLDHSAIVQNSERCQFPHAEVHFYPYLGKLSGSVAAFGA